MTAIYKQFVREDVSPEGVLRHIEFDYPKNFNFAFDVVDALGVKAPQKRAMVWLSQLHEEKSFTFLDMARNSAKCANYLKSLGIKKGDRVMLVLRRNYQFWAAILALHKLGAIAIPATDQLKAKDFVYRFNAAGVRAVICTAFGTAADAIDESLPQCPTVEFRLMNGESPKEGWLPLDAGIQAASDFFPRPTGEEATLAEDTMLMYFTSGTTGYPKIAMHSFTYPLGHLVTARYWQNVNPAGVHFTVSDTGWGKAVWGKLYGQWLCEACVLTYDFDRFRADDLLQIISAHGVTTFCAPPTIYRFMIQEDLRKYDLSGLQYAVIAGEALNPEVYNRFYELTGLKLMEGFGQTETTLTVLNPVGTTPKPGSMGRPSPQYTVTLLGANGGEAKPGEVGEIVIKTDKGIPAGMFKGYYQDEERTLEAWNKDVYHTGDMAWRDEDGYFWYVGRSDDLIKSSGYRIGPFEIESVLMEHPSVLECAVTGVPDPVRGQAVKATVVLARGYEPSDELARELQVFVKDATAPYKYPRVVEFVAELPKTISGKIRRVELRDAK